MVSWLTEYENDGWRAMGERVKFSFRPWVRRAGLSIVLVASAATVALGWIGERAIWVYIATLMIGGLKVWIGTMRPVAEVSDDVIVLRPLHNLRQRVIAWRNLRGTEQMTGGDRLIVYYDTPRGMRFAALNLNLVKGRREFLALVDSRLRAMNFIEKQVGRSRYLSRLDAQQRTADEHERDRE